MNEVVSVTKKGQATIPKRLRTKYHIKERIIFEEKECGLVIKPVPTPNELFGSFKSFAKGKTTRQLLEEARKEENTQDKELIRHARKSDV